VDEESRRVAMDSAKAIDEAARHRTVCARRRRGEGAVSSPALGLTMLGLIVDRDHDGLFPPRSR